MHLCYQATALYKPESFAEGLRCLLGTAVAVSFESVATCLSTRVVRQSADQLSGTLACTKQ